MAFAGDGGVLQFLGKLGGLGRHFRPFVSSGGSSWSRASVPALRRQYLSGRRRLNISQFRSGGFRRFRVGGRRRAFIRKGRSKRMLSRSAHFAKANFSAKRFRRRGVTRGARRLLRKMRVLRTMSQVLAEPKTWTNTVPYNLSHVGADKLYDGVNFYRGGRQSWQLFPIPALAYLKFMLAQGLDIATVAGVIPAGAFAGVGPTQKVFVEKYVQRWQLRNNYNQDCEVRCYMLWPRRNISFTEILQYTGATPADANFLDALPNTTTTGASPATVVAVQSTWPTEQVPAETSGFAVTNQIKNFMYEWSPYQDTVWPTCFKIKPLASFRLQPGESRELNYKMKPFVLSKSRFGLAYASDFEYTGGAGQTVDQVAMRGFPIMMIGVRGTITHDQTKVPVTNDGAHLDAGFSNIRMGQVPGDYNVDILMTRDWRVRRAVEKVAGTMYRATGQPIQKVANVGTTGLLEQWSNDAPTENAPPGV